MGDTLFFGVLRMPYELAMADELSRLQYWQRGQQAADEIERLREALRDIACDCEHECADSPYMAGPVTPNCCRNFARSALEGKE